MAALSQSWKATTTIPEDFQSCLSSVPGKTKCTTDKTTDWQTYWSLPHPWGYNDPPAFEFRQDTWKKLCGVAISICYLQGNVKWHADMKRGVQLAQNKRLSFPRWEGDKQRRCVRSGLSLRMTNTAVNALRSLPVMVKGILELGRSRPPKTVAPVSCIRVLKHSV